MTTLALGDQPVQPLKIVKGVGIGETLEWQVEIPIGASGAVGTLAGPFPNGFTCTKNTTGIYDCTGLPALPTGGRFIMTLFSPALTIFDAAVTAYSPTAGTMTFKTVAGTSTPVQPASGDKIWIHFSGERF